MATNAIMPSCGPRIGYCQIDPPKKNRPASRGFEMRVPTMRVVNASSRAMRQNLALAPRTLCSPAIHPAKKNLVGFIEVQTFVSILALPAVVHRVLPNFHSIPQTNVSRVVDPRTRRVTKHGLTATASPSKSRAHRSWINSPLAPSSGHRRRHSSSRARAQSRRWTRSLAPNQVTCRSCVSLATCAPRTMVCWALSSMRWIPRRPPRWWWW